MTYEASFNQLLLSVEFIIRSMNIAGLKCESFLSQENKKITFEHFGNTMAKTARNNACFLSSSGRTALITTNRQKSET